MLANTADTGTLEYNTVDATLWFLHAVGRHVARTGDLDLAAELVPTLLDDRRRATSPAPATASASTRPTACSPQGAAGLALTWMDARVDGVPVTPRVGKPVEVNALWINGLAVGRRTLGAAATRRRCHDVARCATRARASFATAFATGDGLSDCARRPPATTTAAPEPAARRRRCRTRRCDAAPVVRRRARRC